MIQGLHSALGLAEELSAKPASSKWSASDLLRLSDLTSLEGSDTSGKVEHLCLRAIRCEAAGVCVYPLLLPVAAKVLKGSTVRAVSAAGGFPSGLTPIESRLTEIRWCRDHGADEIDTVINRSAILEGDWRSAERELAAMREAAGATCLKVILETGELDGPAMVYESALLAMRCGADFVKTSTGKSTPGATLEAAASIAVAIEAFESETKQRVGLKVSGGLRSNEAAIRYLELIERLLGREWLVRERFRFGISSLADDLIRDTIGN